MERLSQSWQQYRLTLTLKPLCAHHDLEVKPECEPGLKVADQQMEATDVDLCNIKYSIYIVDQ